MEDTITHQQLRNKLVAELQAKGITDENVLAAMRKVPRHLYYFDQALSKQAYTNIAFPLDSGQTISHPYTVALQSQLLNVTKRLRVLEIGTGSGYQASILSAMGAIVYSIERQQELYIKTKNLLSQLNYPIFCYYGDGFKGLPQFAPFDRIIITAAAPYISRELLEQLKVNGILVSPIKNGDKQEMLKIVKISDTEFEQTTHGECAFVPMLKGLN